MHCVANGIANQKLTIGLYPFAIQIKSTLFPFPKKRYIYGFKKKTFFYLNVCAEKKKYIYFYMSFPTKSKWHLSIGIDPDLVSEVEFGTLH